MRFSKQGKVFGFVKGNKINVGRTHTKKYLPNTYFKDFLKKMKKEKRRIWLKDFGRKQSLRILNDKKYMEKLRLRMIDNTYKQDYLIKHPVWIPPDFSQHTPHISVPVFVPIINQNLSNLSAVNYYTKGIIPSGVCQLR